MPSEFQSEAHSANPVTTPLLLGFTFLYALVAMLFGLQMSGFHRNGTDSLRMSVPKQCQTSHRFTGTCSVVHPASHSDTSSPRRGSAPVAPRSGVCCCRLMSHVPLSGHEVGLRSRQAEPLSILRQTNTATYQAQFGTTLGYFLVPFVGTRTDAIAVRWIGRCQLFLSSFCAAALTLWRVPLGQSERAKHRSLGLKVRSRPPLTATQSVIKTNTNITCPCCLDAHPAHSESHLWVFLFLLALFCQFSFDWMPRARLRCSIPMTRRRISPSWGELVATAFRSVLPPQCGSSVAASVWIAPRV